MATAATASTPAVTEHKVTQAQVDAYLNTLKADVVTLYAFADAGKALEKERPKNIAKPLKDYLEKIENGEAVPDNQVPTEARNDTVARLVVLVKQKYAAETTFDAARKEAQAAEKPMGFSDTKGISGFLWNGFRDKYFADKAAAIDLKSLYDASVIGLDKRLAASNVDGSDYKYYLNKKEQLTKWYTSLKIDAPAVDVAVKPEAKAAAPDKAAADKAAAEKATDKRPPADPKALEREADKAAAEVAAEATKDFPWGGIAGGLLAFLLGSSVAGGMMESAVGGIPVIGPFLSMVLPIGIGIGAAYCGFSAGHDFFNDKPKAPAADGKAKGKDAKGQAPGKVADVDQAAEKTDSKQLAQVDAATALPVGFNNDQMLAMLDNASVATTGTKIPSVVQSESPLAFMNVKVDAGALVNANNIEFSPNPSGTVVLNLASGVGAKGNTTDRSIMT